MTTLGEIVTDALRKLKVVAAEAEPRAWQMRDGILDLNRMMIEWEAETLPLGWAAMTEPTDTVPIPPEAEGAVVANLAVYSQPRYGVAASNIVIEQAVSLKASLKAQAYRVTPLYTESPDLPRGSGQYDGGEWFRGFGC